MNDPLEFPFSYLPEDEIKDALRDVWEEQVVRKRAICNHPDWHKACDEGRCNEGREGGDQRGFFGYDERGRRVSLERYGAVIMKRTDTEGDPQFELAKVFASVQEATVAFPGIADVFRMEDKL